MMSKLKLQPEEIQQIQELLAELTGKYESAESPEFQAMAAVYAQELPWRVRESAYDFKLNEPDSGAWVVSNYPVDEERLGPTPPHWKHDERTLGETEEEMFLVMLGALLGECIGWSTQQDGRIVHDILPIAGKENEQLGSGSEELLWWHVEDAFHPYRGDYIGLACLRNPDKVPTTFLCLADLGLDFTEMPLLFEPHYTIRPDESHLLKNKGEDRQVDGVLAQSYDQINTMNTAPDKIAVLFGDPKNPYVRIDPYFMDPIEDNPEAQEALETLISAIDEKIKDMPLNQGEFCFIDNFRGVHGRKPFKARYDGTDRWMKRVNVVRDLRKSRPIRASASSRVMR
ncbi:MAG: guanitoxin biosynthesis L-enduracididine beta-hydroxylase GntD [Acidobacteriota bacterium]|nr:guanitoxin biosynthesis L-enduracididine beta-hydroxylase GntD [Acidobacteriota bacterium]